MMVPRRLMAAMRSKASSVISSGEASPPGDADADIVVQDVDPSRRVFSCGAGPRSRFRFADS
jgi:hypothetical protein